jgi:soluble lytic murein transglycosylase-like protein
MVLFSAVSAVHKRCFALLAMAGALAGTLFCALPAASAREHIVLRNGYDLICDHRQADGQTTRLFMDGGAANYLDIQTSQIAESQPLPPAAPQTSFQAASQPSDYTDPGTASIPARIAPSAPAVLSAPELRQVLSGASQAHDLDLDLLASVVHAESAGRVHAQSHAGAQGLMQLMPGTAAELGVKNTFAPVDNVNGGTAYLDSLLRRYHDNLAFALAAYNAGPAAVDRWHGIPPFPETRAYVARIIHEFNQRYAKRLRAEQSARHASSLSAPAASATSTTSTASAASANQPATTDLAAVNR